MHPAYRCSLRFSIVTDAADHDHEVIRVADEAHEWLPDPVTLGTCPLRSERFPLLDEVLVEGG